MAKETTGGERKCSIFKDAGTLRHLVSSFGKLEAAAKHVCIDAKLHDVHCTSPKQTYTKYYNFGVAHSFAVSLLIS